MARHAQLSDWPTYADDPTETTMTRVRKRFLLDPEAAKRGERYAMLHDTTLSRVVSDFLRSLPLEPTAVADLSPIVRRLYGVAKRARLAEEPRSRSPGR